LSSKVVNPGDVAEGEIITTPFGTATFDAIAPVTPEQSAPIIAATPCEIIPSAAAVAAAESTQVESALTGTSLLVLCYREEEKFKAQGFNDLIVYSIQAIASLSAGLFLSLTSWKTMNLICLFFLIIIIFSTMRADHLKKNPSNQNY
jgi:hypothetical protein